MELFRLEITWRSDRIVKKIGDIFRKWRKEKRGMDMSMFFSALSDDRNNLPPYKSRSVINMVIKAFNFKIFSGKHLFKLYIIEYL